MSEEKGVIDTKEALYYKWKGTIDRNPEYYQTPQDRKIANCPEWCWERYNAEQNVEVLREAYYKIIEAISYYLDCEDDKKMLMALWVIGTYFHEHFLTFPLLFLNAMRGSGKTRTLKLLTKLSKDGQVTNNMSEAALFRSKGTLGLDEVEGIGSKEKQTYRELLNGAYKKGSQIVRIKKKNTKEGEERVEERFDAYRPVIMANIWGMEEVLNDRCITIILEKSNEQYFTKLVENYDLNPIFDDILLLLKSDKCSLCSVVTEKKHNIYTKWNEFIKHTYTLHTLTTLNTLTTLTTQEEEFFKKINDCNIDGRNLELYFPLILIAKDLGEDILDNLLELIKKNMENKRMEDLTESKDITLFQLVASLDEKYYQVKELTQQLRLLLGDSDAINDWLNSKWVGRGLKRLNLVIDKRRVSSGIEVLLDVKKAAKKVEMFG